jgi:hypothetical protein
MTSRLSTGDAEAADATAAGALETLTGTISRTTP